ncbi:DUF7504 family protein [Halorarius halobius]|uniref:DUF7504 family protein n=1 Tax=Halorarius halobius TaxID=2962671 RepID=UPI0020CCE2C7|nr:hypothetical protein [Halorarius halobius]
MTYPAGDISDGLSFDPGTSLLMSGEAPPVRERVLDATAEGLREGETVLLITADRSAERIVDALDDRGGVDPARVGIVDVTNDKGATEVEGVQVSQLSSPSDLTGISLEFAKHLERFESAGQADRVRVGLLSVSTLMMYGELQTVFRFLHVFTSRIRSAELFGLFALHPDMHDDKATNTVRAIFDAEATITGDGVDLRGTGYADA